MSPSYPIVFYVSGHGFGHASRIVNVIYSLRRRVPGVPIVVKTSAPDGLFEAELHSEIEYVPLQCDAGIVQIDSLNLDARESLRRAAAFQRHLPEQAAAETEDLRRRHAQVVVGDIPPLAFEAAAAAGVPSVAIGNFTWDWIYEAYAGRETAELSQSIRRSYQKATRVLRLPLSGGFEGLDAITQRIPLIARASRHQPGVVRSAFGIPPDKPMVLISFGGYGLQKLDAPALAALGRFSIVAGGLTQATIEAGIHVTQITGQQLEERGYFYRDLVRAADVVLTKPGYGIVADCVANDAAIVYTSRGRFAEYDVFVEEMPRYVRAQYLDQQRLLSGDWGEAVDGVLAMPAPPRPALNGADCVVDEIAQLMTQGS